MSIESSTASSSVRATLMRRIVPAMFAWMFAALGAVWATSGIGATLTFNVLVDADNDASTGCSVATANGPFTGVEQVFATTVSTSTTGAAVTGVSRAVCAGGALGAPTTVSAGGWPVGIGNGVGALSVIETIVPLVMLPGSGVIRIAVTASDGAGGVDAMLILNAAGSPILVSLGIDAPALAEIPSMHRLGLLLLAGLLAASGAWLSRRHRYGTLPLAILVLTLSGLTLVWAATVILDGEVSDWAGVAPLATAASRNAATNADLVAVFAQRDATNLYVRIDADVRADAAPVTPVNAAPVVDAGPDQTITLPASVNLSGLVSDDGLPNPPGAITIEWSTVSGPGTVTFGNATAAVTTASFSSAGIYVLRLTVTDGALTTSSNVTVTVEATPVAPPLGLAGAWSGRGVDSNANTGANAATNVTWTLAQTDAGVSGIVTTQSGEPLGTTCNSCHRNKTGTLSGTIAGSTLTLTMSFPAGNPAGNPNDVTPICSASLTGTVTWITQDTLTASYSGADSCEGPLVNGTLTMARQP